MSLQPERSQRPDVPESADQCMSCFFFDFVRPVSVLIIQYLPSAVKLTLPVQ
jgi:hypothetical protein